MAIVVRNTVTDEIVFSGFAKRKDAERYVKDMTNVENAKARLDYWNRTEFPTGELLSR